MNIKSQYGQAYHLEQEIVSHSMAARFHLFCFCFINKYGSTSLKCLFLFTSPIASSRVCWGVHNCLEYDENSQVSYFVLYGH